MASHASWLRGTFPAIVTPFSADGAEVDYDSLASLVEFVIGEKSAGIVVCGSTGEAATLSDAEYASVIRRTVEFVRGRVPCIAGIGGSSTARAVATAASLNELRLDGYLVVTPPYNKPPQDGLVLHFQIVARAARHPIIAYNVPGRTGVNLLPKTVERLAREQVIVGLKDASGSIDQLLDTLALTGDSCAVLSGEDSLVHAAMACGAVGTISATANIIPSIYARLTTAALAGRWDEAKRAQFDALPFARAMFLETNPIPVKTALAIKGIIKHATLRAPLIAAQAATRAKLEELLR